MKKFSILSLVVLLVSVIAFYCISIAGEVEVPEGEITDYGTIGDLEMTPADLCDLKADPSAFEGEDILAQGVVSVESAKAEEGKSCWFLLGCPMCEEGNLYVVLCGSGIKLPSLKDAKFVQIWGTVKIKGEEKVCGGAEIDEGEPYLQATGVRVIE